VLTAASSLPKLCAKRVVVIHRHYEGWVLRDLANAKQRQAGGGERYYTRIDGDEPRSRRKEVVSQRQTLRYASICGEASQLRTLLEVPEGVGKGVIVDRKCVCAR